MEEIAGFLVRRIVSYVNPDSKILKGERIWIIHFGSRVDLKFEAAGIDIKVKKGDKVFAGQTLAIFTPMSSLSVAEKIIEGPKRPFSKLQSTTEEVIGFVDKENI